jgi:hypothetical protein
LLYSLLVVSTRKSPQATEWIVYLVAGAKARRLGTVKAATREEAIATAAAEFGLPPSRMIVQAISHAC